MSGAEPPHGGDAPPPYSETDIYSNSGSGAASAPSTVADDVVSRMSSSNEEIIYTPPDTPRTASIGYDVLTGVPQPGADLYFETRPPPSPDVIPQSTLIHALQLVTQSLPDDFPFPSDWEKRDINAQDWATFINFLLPDHTTRGNNVVLERKLRAEAESEAGESMSSGRSQASLQRHQLRTAGPEALQDDVQRRAHALATVHEWNQGFFRARGITISIAPSGDDEADHNANARDLQDQATSDGGSWWPTPASFEMDAGGITYGKRFVMDSNGIRLGSLIMDARGIRTASHKDDVPRTLQDAGVGASSRRMPGLSGPEPERGRAQVIVSTNGKGKDTARDRSISSASSVSSASSSSSASSLDSLPDHDDVREQQLPAYVNILRDWTSKPNHLRTNADVVWLKNELSLAKSHVADPHADKRELKAQVKVLLKQWKQIQREQRKTQRDARMARKKQRHQEKRERRQWKRDVKRTQRNVRRAERDVRRHGGHLPTRPCMPPMPHGPSMPSMPHMPSIPHVSAMPAMPHGMHGPPSMRFHDHRPHHHPHETGHFGSRGGWPHHVRGGLGRGGFSGAWPPRGPPTHASRAGPRGPPGRWPDGDGDHDAAAPVPNAAVAAKYAAPRSIEDAIREQQDKVDRMEDGPGKDAMRGAIASMTQSLGSLRVDADAEYARHVAGSDIAQERSVITTATCWNSANDCLCYKKGAKITNVTFPSDEWWHGTYKGKTGYFPANHAKLVPI